MSKLMNVFGKSFGAFMKDEEGAQVVEYALIIAVVSIALVLLLGGSTTSGLGSAFDNLVTRVTACLGTATCS